jgi:hypothetical protein
MENLSNTVCAVESRARRLARRLDMRIEKSRARILHSNNKGEYQLIDDRNTVIDGADYDLSLEELYDRLKTPNFYCRYTQRCSE